jgi:hypothetical protein
MLAALDFHLSPHKQILLAGNPNSDDFKYFTLPNTRRRERERERRIPIVFESFVLMSWF